VDGPPDSPSDPTVASEPGSTKSVTEAAGPFAQKAATAIQAVSVRLRRNQQRRYMQSKSFRLKGEHEHDE